MRDPEPCLRHSWEEGWLCKFEKGKMLPEVSKWLSGDWGRDGLFSVSRSRAHPFEEAAGRWVWIPYKAEFSTPQWRRLSPKVEFPITDMQGMEMPSLLEISKAEKEKGTVTKSPLMCCLCLAVKHQNVNLILSPHCSKTFHVIIAQTEDDPNVLLQADG